MGIKFGIKLKCIFVLDCIETKNSSTTFGSKGWKKVFFRLAYQPDGSGKAKREDEQSRRKSCLIIIRNGV